MPEAKINFKYKIGDVLDIKENNPFHIPAGKYVVHMITAALYDPDMTESSDKEFFLEDLNSQDRDWSFNEQDIPENDTSIVATNEEVELYSVSYHDEEDDTDNEDLVYVLVGTEITAEYLASRVETKCGFIEEPLSLDDCHRCFQRHHAKVLSWKLIKRIK